MYSLYNATRLVIGWMWFQSVSQYSRRKWHININLPLTACCALSWVIVLFGYIMDTGPLNYLSIPAFGLQRTVMPDNADVTQYSSHGLTYAYSPIHLPGLSSSAHKFTRKTKTKNKEHTQIPVITQKKNIERTFLISDYYYIVILFMVKWHRRSHGRMFVSADQWSARWHPTAQDSR